MRMNLFLMTTAVTGLACVGMIGQLDSAPSSQELTGSNYREWLQYIRPSKDEVQWRQIAWRNRLMPAVAEARQLNRPILLWAMNGNPCGET